MLFYPRWARVVFAACVLVLLTGCGSKKFSMGTLSKTWPAAPSAGAPSTTNSVRFTSSGLKAEPHYSYDYSRFPKSGDFAVVPMDTGMVPAVEEPGRFQIAPIALPGSDNNHPAFSLRTAGATNVTAHFRYDPARWDVETVITTNPWTSEHFLALDVIESPGVLLINSIPSGAGAPAATTAKGEFAQVLMRPAGSRGVSDVAPTTDPSMGIIWSKIWVLHTPPTPPSTITTYGTINYRLDGQLGDLASKNGDLSGTELSDATMNNYLHTLLMSNIGYAYSASDEWTSPVFSFNEALTGDTDNNGEVNISDITPLGQFQTHDSPSDVSYHSQRGLHVSGGAGWFNLKHDEEQTGGIWHDGATHDVNSFWYLDQSGWSDPTDFVARSTSITNHPSTDTANTVDANWDGFVYDWYNYNSNPFGSGYNSYLDNVGTEQFHPGDTPVLSRHYNERLSGYQVYTVAHGASGYTYTNPPPGTPPGSAINAVNYYRQDPYNPRPGLTPTPVPYTKPFYDSSWAGYTDPGNADYATYGGHFSQYRFKRSEIDVNLNNASDFWTSTPSSDTVYDILVYPYYWDGSSANLGPCSRISNAFTYQVDDFGPQYRTSNVTPDDTSTSKGLFSVTQLTDYNSTTGITFEFVYDNADDVVPADAGSGERWATSNSAKNVKYELYAHNGSGSLFSYPLSGHIWTEGSDRTAGPGSTERVMDVTLTPTEVNDVGNPLPHANGQVCYFGIRALEAGSSPHAEYDKPGGGTPNTTVQSITIGTLGRGPQYGDGTGSPSDSSSGNSGIISVTQSSQNQLAITYYNADQVTHSGGSDHWGTGNVNYELYASTSDTGTALFDPTHGNWEAAGSKIWDETSTGHDTDNSDGTRTQTYTFASGSTLAGWLAAPGTTIHFGIQAYMPTSGTVEYAGADVPNAHYANLTVSDQSGPYFVYPTGPASSHLTEVDNDDFYVNSVSLDGAVEVQFYPAIDPPLYNGTDDITYHCYWKTSSFSLATIGTANELSSPLTFAYNDKYSPPKAFDRNSLVYLLDNNGSGFSAGQQIWFIIIAKDSSNNASANSVVHSQTARAVNNTESLVLASGLSFDVAYVPGDIQADASDVYVAYPSGQNGGSDPYTIDETAQVSYRRFHTGEASPTDTDSDVLSGASYLPEAGISKLSLTHRVDSSGNRVNDTNGERMPIIAYNGLDFSGSFGSFSYLLYTMSSSRTTGGTWGTHTFHDQSYPTSWEWSDSQLIYPFTRTTGGSTTSTYVLSWVYDPIGTMYHQIRYQSSSNPDSWSGGISTLDASEPYDYNADLVARASYALQTIPMGTFTNVPTREFYLLVSQQKTNWSDDSTDPPTIYNFSPKVDIYSTTDLSSWNKCDVAANLPSLQSGATVVGNSLEAVVNGNAGTHTLYVPYYNTPFDESASDANGLRIAYSTDSGTGPGSWTSPVSAGLIDGTACLGQGQNCYDQLDLRVKPASTVSDYTFDSLGCAYINQHGYLYVAETSGTGSGASWVKQTVAGIHEIDEGQILWVKLAYFHLSGGTVPYVLYARRTTGSGGFSVCLWRPGGF